MLYNKKQNQTLDIRLPYLSFFEDDFAKIIQDLDPNKAYGHNKISICMLKI